MLGKYLGGMLSLFPIVVISFIVGLVIASASPATTFNVGDLLRLVMILVISLLYVSICYLLGLLLSVWTKEAATTLILSMFIWGILTIVHSNIAMFAVTKFPPYKPQPPYLSSEGGLSQKPVDPDAVPKFKERISYQSVIFPVGLLILFNVLFFTAAQLSFLKCDLK